MEYYIQLLLIWLWGTVGSAMTFHAEPPPPGNGISNIALTYCYSNGRSEVWIRPELPTIVYVHEWTHALDCADDGQLNSSLFAVPDQTGPIACAECNSPVERQAVWVHQNPQASYPALLSWARMRQAVWGANGGLRAGTLK